MRGARPEQRRGAGIRSLIPVAFRQTLGERLAILRLDPARSAGIGISRRAAPVLVACAARSGSRVTAKSPGANTRAASRPGRNPSDSGDRRSYRGGDTVRNSGRNPSDSGDRPSYRSTDTVRNRPTDRNRSDSGDRRSYRGAATRLTGIPVELRSDTGDRPADRVPSELPRPADPIAPVRSGDRRSYRGGDTVRNPGSQPV